MRAGPFIARLRSMRIPQRLFRGLTVFDIAFIALGIGFFAAGCLYLYACDRL